MPNSASQSPAIPEEHFRQIAAIFTLAVRRHMERQKRYQPQTSNDPEKDVAKGLEVLGETRLSVSRVSC